MRTDERESHGVTPAVTERRRSVRVEVVGGIQGETQPDNLPVALLNVSDGGFLMRTPISYLVGDIHKFRFTTDSDLIVLRARVAHVMRVTTNGTASYMIGAEFVDHQINACAEAIDRLVNAASHAH